MFSILLSSFLFKGLQEVTIGTQFGSQAFLTEPFVAPKLNISKNIAPQPGYLFYGVSGEEWVSPATPAPLIMDSSGEVIWLGASSGYTYNFRKQSYKNQDVLTYWHGHGDSFGHGYGRIHILDNTYRKIHEVCLSGNFVTPHPALFPGKAKNPCYFDVHESYITDRGTVLGTAFNITRADLRKFNGPEDGWIFDALFFEIDIATGKELFRWSAFEHVPLEKSNYFGDDKSEPLLIRGQKSKYGVHQSLPWDFFHMNSVQAIPGGYLVNSRMTWSTYFVNGTDGSIIWTLEGSSGGDFTLGEGIYYSWQHMPRMVSGDDEGRMKISLFNNANINQLVSQVNQSTGYLLEVNTKDMTVTKLRDLRDDANVVYSTAEGSYQALGEAHALLGYGTMAIIKEFNGEGEVVYDAQFAPLSYRDPDEEHGHDVHSYRTYKYEWEAEPWYPPKVASFNSTPDGSVYVYMSWNGATSYDSWNIYAGDSEFNMQKVASNVPRSGFETMHVLKGAGLRHTKFQVEALRGGKSLRNSTFIDTRSDI